MRFHNGDGMSIAGNGGGFDRDFSRDDALMHRFACGIDDKHRLLTLRQSRRVAWKRKVRRGW